MTRWSKILLFILAGVLFSRIMPAQNLPSLPADGKIQRGTLQCGASYYMVNNPEVKGYADIAVVQRDESPSGLTRKRLSTSFFARRGVGPRPTGYFREQDGSTILNFDHVPVYETAVLDSALLSTFSLMAGSRAEQAVIVSGDIDPVELKKKMDILSMLVPKRYGKPVGSQDYVWEPSVSPTITLEKTPGKSRASVKVAYASPRTRQEYMNTAQALVMDILSREFLTVASRRIRRGLENAGIPYGSLETRYLSSAETSGDEEFALIVHTDPAHLQAAMKVISSSLAGLDGFGIPEEEFTDTKQVMMADMIRRGEAPLSNREYTDRCIAHFLYGASLAPYSEQTQLFARKNLPDSTQTRLFNRFTTSLLSQLSNLTLTYRAPLDSLDEDDALFQYNLAYLYGSTFQDAQKYDWRWTDTLSLEAQCPKVRLSSTRKDAVSGGELWTFSNGVRVVYKQVPGSGMFSYALLLHGGLASIDGLAEGEGGYFRDMLSLYNVAGIPSMRFRDFLDVSGIQMQADVMSTCMTLRGSAPGQKLQTLFKCLLALANERTPNRSAFDTFAQNTALEEESMEDRMTGYLEPGWALSARRDPAALTPGTQAKAEKYFEGRFSRVDDGVIVLCGDLDETTLKRVLMRYVGGFRTGRGTTGRPGVKPRTLTGTHPLTGTEPGSGVWVLMDA